MSALNALCTRLSTFLPVVALLVGTTLMMAAGAVGYGRCSCGVCCVCARTPAHLLLLMHVRIRSFFLCAFVCLFCGEQSVDSASAPAELGGFVQEVAEQGAHHFALSPEDPDAEY